MKQLLVHLREIEEKTNKHRIRIVDNTRAIVFLSTPHLGSAVAKTMKNFRLVSYPSHETIELASNSSYLVELNRKFIDLVK